MGGERIMVELEIDQEPEIGDIVVDEYDSDGISIDVSDQDTVELDMKGARGGRTGFLIDDKDEDGNPLGNPSEEQLGGRGGRIIADLDVSDLDELVAYSAVGYGGETVRTDKVPVEESDGGLGFFNGGDGGFVDEDNFGGGGGGSAALLDGSDNVLAIVDGGGGAGNSGYDNDTTVFSIAGGGGARGGEGGTALDADGQDGEDSGFGGDGATEVESISLFCTGGEPGGQEIVDSGRFSNVIEETGSGSVEGNASIEVGVSIGTEVQEELDVLSYRDVNTYLEERHADVVVLRDEWQQVIEDLDKRVAEMTVVDSGENLFGGRLVSYDNRESVVELQLGTYEEDALKSQPSDDIEQFNGVSDGSIVESAIENSQTVSPGVIEDTVDDLSFIFSNSSFAKVIREVQRTEGTFVRYNADKTVDYLENLGEDKSNTVTIGPDQQNITDEFEVIENDREDVTHIRVLGSQEGRARITAEVVVDDYIEGTLQSWKKYKDKEITSEDRALEVANTIKDEYQNEPRVIEVETRVFGADLELGDFVKVESDIDNIDETLRVVSVEKILDGSEFVYQVRLSNRLLTREDSGKDNRRDIEKFNEGFQGDIVNPTVGVRDAVGANGSFEFKFRKPDDVVQELKETILVETSEYRAHNSDGVDVTNELATDIDVYINDTLEIEGATVAFTDFDFDVTGSFSEGFNTIRLENNDDEAADVQVFVFTDYYRQITADSDT